MRHRLRQWDRRFYFWFRRRFATEDVEMNDLFRSLCPENFNELSVGWDQWEVGQRMSGITLVIALVGLIVQLTGTLIDIGWMHWLGLALFVLGIIAHLHADTIRRNGRDKYHYEDGFCSSDPGSDRSRSESIDKHIYQKGGE